MRVTAAHAAFDSAGASFMPHGHRLPTPSIGRRPTEGVVRCDALGWGGRLTEGAVPAIERPRSTWLNRSG